MIEGKIPTKNIIFVNMFHFLVAEDTVYIDGDDIALETWSFSSQPAALGSIPGTLNI